MRRTGTVTGTGATRRHVLAGTGAAAAGLLGGCSSGGSADDGTSGSTPDAREAAAFAEAALRTRTAAASLALVTQYDAVLAMHPALRTRLTPLRAQSAEHVKALSGKPLPAPSATPGISTAPADPDEALSRLAAAERHTSDAHLTALDAAPPELARLLASVAACGAGHAYLLGGGAR